MNKILCVTLLGGSLALAGCVNPTKSSDSSAQTEAKPQQAATTTAAPAPAAKPVCKEVPAAKTGKKTAQKPAQDPDCVPAEEAADASLAKNKPVTDSTKVEAGQGTKVKGINDWEGEITGVPAANSRFKKLKIGMPIKQVTDMIGQPTDQGAYITGKAFIPFYFGSDKSRWEMVYKGQGRLIFSSQAGFNAAWHLTWVIHNPNEPGYR